MKSNDFAKTTILLGLWIATVVGGRQAGATEQSDLTVALETLAHAKKGEASNPPFNPLGLNLVSYTRYWRLSTSANEVYIVIDSGLSGEVLGFEPNGHLGGRRKIGEPVDARLMPLGDDDADSLLLTVVDAGGTGVHQDGYHIYRLARGGLLEVWHGIAFAYCTMCSPPEPNEIQGYIRGSEGADCRIEGPCVVYLRREERGRRWTLRETRFKWQNGRFGVIHWSPPAAN